MRGLAVAVGFLFIQCTHSFGSICGLGVRVGSIQSASELAQVYAAILEDSQVVFSPHSLKSALENASPLALEGEGPLFFQTEAALGILRSHILSFEEDQQRVVIAELLEVLRNFAPSDAEIQVQQVSTFRAGIAAPLEIPYPLPRAGLPTATGIYSPDGEYLITVAKDGVVTTFSRRGSNTAFLYKTGSLDPDGHCDLGNDFRPYAIDVSPDGKFFAFVVPSVDSNGGPYVLETTTGKLVRTFPRKRPLPGTKEGAVARVQFSPNGQFIGVGGFHRERDDRFIWPPWMALWNLTSNSAPISEKNRQETTWGRSIAFSPDSSFFFASDGHIIDTEQGREILHPMEPSSLSSDAETEWHNIQRATIPWGTEVAVHPAHSWLAIQDHLTEPYLEVAIGDYSGLKSSYLRKTRTLQSFDGERRKVRYAAEEGIDFWTLFKKKQNTKKDKGAVGGGLRFSPDGTFLVSHFYNPKHRDRDATLEVFWLESTVQREREPHVDLSQFVSSKIQQMEFSRDGKVFVTLDYSFRLSVFSLPDFKLIGSVGSQQHPILYFVISPESRRLFTIEENGIARERNLILEAESEAKR